MIGSNSLIPEFTDTQGCSPAALAVLVNSLGTEEKLNLLERLVHLTREVSSRHPESTREVPQVERPRHAVETEPLMISPATLRPCSAPRCSRQCETTAVLHGVRGPMTAAEQQRCRLMNAASVSFGTSPSAPQLQCIVPERPAFLSTNVLPRLVSLTVVLVAKI